MTSEKDAKWRITMKFIINLYSEIVTEVNSSLYNYNSLAICNNGDLLLASHNEYPSVEGESGDEVTYGNMDDCNGIGIYKVEKQPVALSHDYMLDEISSINCKYGPVNAINAIALSSDGRILITGSNNKKVEVYYNNKKGYKHFISFLGHTDFVTSVIFISENHVIASSSADGTIKIWDILRKKESMTLSGHHGKVNSIAFNSNRKILASGGVDKNIKLWDIETGFEIKTFSGHNLAITALAFSPEGKVLASSSGEHTIKLWDTETGKNIGNLIGHHGAVNTIAFNADGTRLASGGEDKKIKVWDISTKTVLQSIVGHPGHIKSMVFSPNDLLLYSCCSSAIKIWGLNYTSSMRKTITKLSGVSFGNRQEFIQGLRKGMLLSLDREPYNKLDGNSISVNRMTYESTQSNITTMKIGYLSKEMAARVSQLMDLYGFKYLAYVREVTGGSAYHLGINIEIQKGIYEECEDDETYYYDYEDEEM